MGAGWRVGDSRNGSDTWGRTEEGDEMDYLYLSLFDSTSGTLPVKPSMTSLPLTHNDCGLDEPL